MMMMVNKALANELQEVVEKKNKFENALKDLPAGCLAVRKIRGNDYYYLVKRVGKKVQYIYKGKVTEMEKKKYQEIKEQREKYRATIAKMKKQIKFLNTMIKKDLQLFKMFSA